jgi:hypothetical protein
MSESTEYRIEFSVQRTEDGEFVEIGFGSSIASGRLDDALYSVQAQIQRRDWETTDGQPDPETVDSC